MDQHAPGEIESDTAQVRDTLKRLQGDLGQGATDPIGALAATLVAYLTSAGAFQRVGDYLQAHCPLNSAVSGNTSATRPRAHPRPRPRPRLRPARVLVFPIPPNHNSWSVRTATS